MEIIYDKVKKPVSSQDMLPVKITEQTKAEHIERICKKMQEEDIDVLVIYGDREHGANFAYLTGFETRFEEAVLVLYQNAKAYMLLGNENIKMCQHSWIKATPIHVPYFSLPNQPMGNSKCLEELFEGAEISDGMHIGIVGWKLFTSSIEDNKKLFDVPYFITDALMKLNPTGTVTNEAHIFIHPGYGARVCVNANEIAHYEYGAALASIGVISALNEIEPEKTELQIAEYLYAHGQPLSVTTICATGERFSDAVVFPRNKKIQIGDKFSVTMGLRGGLSSRAAYVVYSEAELDNSVRDYLEVMAKPYFKAAVIWYETVEIGISGKEMYQAIANVLPKEQYHWTLNPGHLTANEEWMSSPIFPQSDISLASGMMMQMDIIPQKAGYGGVGAEDGIVLADEDLQKELKNKYPPTFARMMRRRKYMYEELGINLKPEVLPMSDIAGYLRPYLLQKDYALKYNHGGNYAQYH